MNVSVHSTYMTATDP